MIPKIIHYCWFGGNELSDRELYCISSWKKFCPGYEIRRWDEKCFDVNSNRYCKEAYERKKWAFVSDYARFKILYEEGGLYFDTDVEMIKSIDDIVEKGSFFGFERADFDCAVAPGLGMGVERHNNLYKEILQYYDNTAFIRADGKENLRTVVDLVTMIFREHGLESDLEIQEICGFYLYPYEYFSPMNFITGKITLTENTRSIHHYTGSWKTPLELKIQERQYQFVSIFGEKIGLFFGFIYGALRCCCCRIQTNGFPKTIVHYLRILSRGKTND